MRRMSISRRSGARRMSSSAIAEPVDPGRDRQRAVEPVLVPLVVRRVMDANGDRQRRVEIRDDGDHQHAIAGPVGMRLHDADAGIGARLQIEPRERFGDGRVETRRPRLHGQAAVLRLDEPPLPPGAIEAPPAPASRDRGRRRPPSSVRGSPRTRRAGATPADHATQGIAADRPRTFRAAPAGAAAAGAATHPRRPRRERGRSATDHDRPGRPEGLR